MSDGDEIEDYMVQPDRRRLWPNLTQESLMNASGLAGLIALRRGLMVTIARRNGLMALSGSIARLDGTGRNALHTGRDQGANQQ